MNPLSAVYGQVARFRRQWYEQRPERRRRLGCPVISVGNLTLGGSGKTPVVALVAELLRDAGYVPAVLSRGYKRRRRTGEVVVVSDRSSVRADVEASGDEPQLLARRLPGVPVVVSVDRARAGTLAQQQLGANALILDDGFQHLQVARDVDLLLAATADLSARVVPAGRLREPLDAARRADAVLVTDAMGNAEGVAQKLGVNRAFAVRTRYERLRLVRPYGGAVAAQPQRVIALAAIARPRRFLDGLRALGFDVAQEMVFRDHHWFTAADVGRVQRVAREAGAEAIVTTEKDAVRLEDLKAGDVPLMYLPIAVDVEPAEAFRDWLLARVAGRARA